MLFVVPGLTRPGERCDTPVDFMNIYPTLADLCGLPITDQLDGVSMKPLLQNPDSPWQRPALTTHGRGNDALRTRTHRYIRYADGSEELYDHRTDPMEWDNLAGQPGSEAIIARLKQWLPESNAPNAASDPDVRSNPIINPAFSRQTTNTRNRN
jgi:arylsulfatase A-like enzyme